MKTIVHIVNSNRFSGLESVACDIIRNTSDKFNEFYVTQNGPIVDVLKERKIQYYIIHKMSTKEIKKMIDVLKPDLIHAHDYKASCVASLTRTNIPIISHLHNNSPWIKTLHPFSFLYLYCSRKFRKILTVSDSIEKEYIFSKKISDKIKCIGNPISKEKILSKIDKNTEKKYDICCVARITKQKNPSKFIDVIYQLKKKIPNIKAIWIGEGELLDESLQKVKELGLEKNIQFLGFKKNPYQYMAESKVFVLTSDWEGFGLVAFEALTLGLPCFVSNVGGLPTIVDSTCGKLCSNVEDYMDIIKILSNHEEYKKYSELSKIKASKLNNIDNYMKTIIDIYEAEIKCGGNNE